jgi:hypothetical protein
VEGKRGRYVGDDVTDLGTCAVSDILLYSKCMLSTALSVCNFKKPEKFVNPQSVDDLNTKN